MSREAQLWVSQLPLDTGVNLAAFRVLDKLADAHHNETQAAYRSVERLAAELECSQRTVQRALKDLEVKGLISRGDQRLLSHLRADRRPTVYRINLHRFVPATAQLPLDGVTTAVTPSQPVDNLPRGDRHAVHGVTTVVALGTQEHREQVPRPATDRARGVEPAQDAPTLLPCLDGSQRHEFSRKAGVCVYCGIVKPRR